MATGEVLFQEELAKGPYFASIVCSIEVDPDAGRVELISQFVCNSPEGTDKFLIRHKGMVANPIELAVIATWLTSKYAICVAGKFIADTTKEMYLSYGESKQREGASLGERTRAFGDALKARKRNIAAGSLSGFAGCAAAVFIVS